VKILFNKYEGTGNDFVIIDNRRLSFISEKNLVEKICSRRFGIGADGLILIEPSDSSDFYMRYYNSDGLEGTMCGNGGRCAAHFSVRNSIAPKDMTFMTIDGPHSAIVDGNHVQLSMSDVTNIERTKGSCFLNTGSPHHIEFVADPNRIDVVKEGRKIRYSETYAPKGANINFISVTEKHLVVRTYERGVEDETLSCGTGVTASAIAAVFCGHIGSCPVKIKTRGGFLSVSFLLEGTRATNITLSGPATFVFRGEIEI